MSAVRLTAGPMRMQYVVCVAKYPGLCMRCWRSNTFLSGRRVSVSNLFHVFLWENAVVRPHARSILSRMFSNRDDQSGTTSAPCSVLPTYDPDSRASSLLRMIYQKTALFATHPSPTKPCYLRPHRAQLVSPLRVVAGVPLALSSFNPRAAVINVLNHHNVRSEWLSYADGPPRGVILGLRGSSRSSFCS